MPPTETLLAQNEGCDPDSIPARYCCVFPITDLHEAFVRSIGSWAGVRDRIAKDHVRSVEVLRDGAPFARMAFDENGRLVGEQTAIDPVVDWQVEYAADGSVLRFEEMNGSQPASHARKLKDACVVVSVGLATTTRACWQHGDELLRQSDRFLVKATQRAGRTELELGGFEVQTRRAASSSTRRASSSARPNTRQG